MTVLYSIQLLDSCWFSLGLMPESKRDLAVIYNTLVFGAAALFLRLLWLWHDPKHSPSKYDVQVLSKHL